MKKILLGLMLIASTSFGAIGGMTSDILDTAVTNLPTTFTDADSERLSNLKFKTRVAVTNDTSTALFVCFKSRTAATCQSPGDWYVPANGSFIFDEVATGTSVFLRSAGAAISSGIIATGSY